MVERCVFVINTKSSRWIIYTTAQCSQFYKPVSNPMFMSKVLVGQHLLLPSPSISVSNGWCTAPWASKQLMPCSWINPKLPGLMQQSVGWSAGIYIQETSVVACSGRGRSPKARAIRRNYGGICRPWCERKKQSRRPLMNSPPNVFLRPSTRSWPVFDPRLHQLLHRFSTGHHANSAVWNSNLLMPLQFNASSVMRHASQVSSTQSLPGSYRSMLRNYLHSSLHCLMHRWGLEYSQHLRN